MTNNTVLHAKILPQIWIKPQSGKKKKTWLQRRGWFVVKDGGGEQSVSLWSMGKVPFDLECNINKSK